MKKALCDPRVQALVIVLLGYAAFLLVFLLRPQPTRLCIQATPTAIRQFHEIPRGALSLYLDLENDEVVAVKVMSR